MALERTRKASVPVSLPVSLTCGLVPCTARLASAGVGGYAWLVKVKLGRVENGTVVLAEPIDASDGTRDTVLIESDAVEASDAELAAIDAGLAEAGNEGRIDARSFLRQLRGER